MNSTVSSAPATPFYDIQRSDVIPGLPDQYFALLGPVVAYWVYSMVFHMLDTSNWAWSERYRIHESEEMLAKNKATLSEVVRAVLVQQVLQTVVGWYWVDQPAALPNHALAIARLTPKVVRAVVLLLGKSTGNRVLLAYGARLVSFTYWWGIPTAQFVGAFLFIDTWQYFIHRLFHLNTFLYRHIHSVHHRLYVPYAFGALYNHWLEGLFLDSLGAALAESLTGMTARQAATLFIVSTLKTVDDHCGYTIPWDPLQILFGNNATYHDIHHRTWGAKVNFSQPFFVHFDVLFGTRYDGPAPALKKQKVA